MSRIISENFKTAMGSRPEHSVAMTEGGGIHENSAPKLVNDRYWETKEWIKAKRYGQSAR